MAKNEIYRPGPLLPFPYQLREQIQTTSMDTTPKARRGKTRSDLVHLRPLPSNQPATKIGRVVWAWPEIEAGLEAGLKLNEVWEAAGRDGLKMSYAQFRVCVSRLRRRHPKPSTSVPEQPPPQTSADGTVHHQLHQLPIHSEICGSRGRKRSYPDSSVIRQRFITGAEEQITRVQEAGARAKTSLKKIMKTGLDRE